MSLTSHVTRATWLAGLLALFVCNSAKAELLLSQNLGASAYSASGSYGGDIPENAFNGNDYDLWNSGGHPTQWIEVDLQQAYHIGRLRLVVDQSPPGSTVHEIWLSNAPIQNDLTGATLAYTISESTYATEILQPSLSPSIFARYVQIRTTTSPSWVAWSEVSVYGSPIPEPTSLTMLGLGAMGLIAIRWQRR